MREYYGCGPGICWTGNLLDRDVVPVLVAVRPQSQSEPSPSPHSVPVDWDDLIAENLITIYLKNGKIR